VRLRRGKQMRWQRGRIHAHSAKLWHTKDFVAAADAIRPIECWPNRCDLYSEGDAQPREGEECE
jgi:hypothetical protein